MSMMCKMFIHNRNPGALYHFSYLCWVIYYIPYAGLNGVQFDDCTICCVYCDCEFKVSIFNAFGVV